MKIQFLVCVLIWIASIANSQESEKEFHEFLNKIQYELNETVGTNKMEYDTFLVKTNKEYIDFLQDAEKDFIDLLPGSFKDYSLETPIEHQVEPKPIKIEKFVTTPLSGVSISENRNGISPGKETESTLPSFFTAGLNSQTADKLTLQYLGHEFQVIYDEKLKIFKEAVAINPSSLKMYLDTFQKTNYQPTIEQLNIIRNMLNLNDWDYFCLVGEFCKSFSNQENAQHILAWFLLLESNYKVKIGYNRNSTFLFFAPQQTIYQMPWFNIKGVRYYTQQCTSDSVSTYDIDYFKAYKYINLFHDKPILPGEISKVKKISFPYKDSIYNLSLQYNQRYIDYYSKYPNIPIDYYFTQPISVTFKESIAAEIAPLLAHRNQQEILQILLSLVQYGFNYDTDQEQFNKEKYMVPEELLFFNASDCDDRTILFTCLVNELLHNNVIALDYDGHICSAVEVTDSTLQGNFIYNGKKYIVCDPTYMGAPPGIILPAFQTKNATVIDFNKGLNYYRSSEKVWKLANKRGLIQTDNSQNMFITRDGEIFITGLMNNDSTSSVINEKVTSGNTKTFVAKLNTANEIKWVKQLDGSGENMGYCVLPVDDKSFYLFGYFRDSLKLDEFKIWAQEKGSFYVAKMNSLGQTVWLKRIDLPEIDSLSMGITVVLDSTGSLKYYMRNDHYPTDKNFVMQVDKKGYFYLYAMIPVSFSDSSIAKRYGSGSEFDIITFLVNENNSLVKQNYPKSLSLLFTISQYLRQNGSKINGTDLQKTVAAIDRSLILDRSVLYKELREISEIANSNGITLIRTIDGKPVLLNPLQAEHESRLKINYINENARIDILNGVTIGNSSSWNKLNYILLDKSAGEIIYDYDNHYRKKMPVHSELLNY